MKCCSAIVAAFIVSSVAASVPCVAHDTSAAPSTKFDLSEWKITLPADENGDGKVDEVSVRKIQGYSHPDYFYLDAEGRMVFTAPNKAKTTALSWSLTGTSLSV